MTTSDDSAGFVVEEAGAPRLGGDGEPSGAPALRVLDLPVTGWTPEQAAMFLVGLYNIGVFFYGAEWLAHPNEAAAMAPNAAMLLDRIMPRGASGAAEIGVGLVMVASGLSAMTYRRMPLIRRGPRPLWAEPRPAPKPAYGPEAPAPAPPPPPTPPGPVDPLDGGAGYKMAPELVKVAEQHGYEGLGYR